MSSCRLFPRRPGANRRHSLTYRPQSVLVEIQDRVFLVPLLGVHPLARDRLAQYLRDVAVALGFGEDIADVGVDVVALAHQFFYPSGKGFESTVGVHQPLSTKYLQAIER